MIGQREICVLIKVVKDLSLVECTVYFSAAQISVCYLFFNSVYSFLVPYSPNPSSNNLAISDLCVWENAAHY